MARLLILVGLLALGWKMVTGRWPWEPKAGARAQAVFRARKLLGLPAVTTREEILGAHKRLVAIVHPDRGGSDAAVVEANAARDALLAELPEIQESR